MLPTITATDLGNPTEPGDYVFGDMIVRVGSQHLEAWNDTPGAVFKTILCTKMGESSIRLALGGFHLD